MITYYYKNARSKQLSVVGEYQPGVWVCVEKPTHKEISQLVEQFSLDAGHMHDAFDADEMPRLEKEGSLSYVFVRYAYTSDDLELMTSPLLFVIGLDVLITVALHDLPHLQQFVTGKLDFSTAQRTALMLQIMEQTVDQYGVFINTIARQTKVIRSRLRSHEVGNQDFIEFVLIEDSLNEFLSALLPMTAILRRLLLGRHIVLSTEEKNVIEDLMLNTEQSIEGCRSSIKSIVNIRQAYATIASNNLNRTMKILTGATVLITLPNVFFSMFGMNIVIPFAHEWWLSYSVITFTIIVTVFVLILARAKRIL